MEFSNQEPNKQCFHQEVIQQQQTLIAVLKQQIIRLQVRLIDIQKQKDESHKLYHQAQDEIQILKQKIQALKQNNDSLIQTFKVFQRQFVKRDYKIALNTSDKRRDKKITADAPLFMELIWNFKMKSSEVFPEPINTLEKSHLSQYYGYFLHEDLQDSEQQLFNECCNSKKIKVNKITSFGKKNYFNQKYRHFLWFNVIQNKLRISRKQYQILVDKFDCNRENEAPKTTIIDLDLRRMDFKVDEQKSQSIKVEVKKCLQAFKIYRPDIGYVQGMSYIAWMLLVRLQGYQSFVCFSNMILCDPFIHSLYLFKSENIKRIISFYHECLEDKRPKLSKHMKNLLVESQLFIIEWAYTMFSRAFSLRVSSKIWDLWFCQGYNVFFKATMVIMEMLESQILQQNQNDKIIELIRTKTHKLDEVQFLKNLQRQKLFEDLKF